jgi:hypothetical protein
MKNNNMRIYKIYPSHGGNPFHEKDPKKIIGWITDGEEIGDRIIIEILDMSEEEFDKMPEWTGP